MTRMRIAGAALAAMTLAGGLVPEPAEAAWRCGPHGRVCVQRPGGIGVGGAAALGVLGGVALGAAIASSAQPVYAAPAPVYVAPPPVCTVHRDRVWNGWNWEIRSRQVCR